MTAQQPMRILITRPRPDAGPVAAIIEAHGHQPFIEPLMSICPVTGAGVTLDGVQAILLTSANGARALAGATDVRSVPVYAVGDATAGEARSLGFEVVIAAAGDVGSLASRVAGDLEPRGGALLHIAGSHVAGSLAADLSARKFTMRREVLYEARRSDRLSDGTVARIADAGIDAILFYSPRTAAIFVDLASKAGIIGDCGKIDALCLSPAVAGELEALPWRRIRVAARPDQPSLLKLIGIPA